MVGEAVSPICREGVQRAEQALSPYRTHHPTFLKVLARNLLSQRGMQLPYSFGRYILTKKIAQGGMAEIFKAKYQGESGFSKEVVIKRLLPIWSDNPDFTNMLVDEAKALVHLSHPNIVQVFELGKDQKTFFISMEWVEGVDLRRLFLKATQENIEIPLKYTLFIVGEILKALDFAHHKKNPNGNLLHIVHRDISPQNILLSLEGEVKVADFGIAKGHHRSHETTQAQVKGKYAYMSPEQARGEMVDARADIYAVGILLYELLEKRRLFDGVNDLATLEQVRESRLPSDCLQQWPGALRAIVLKALQRKANDRYQTAGEFLKDLLRFTTQSNLLTNALELSLTLKEVFEGELVEEGMSDEHSVNRTQSEKIRNVKPIRYVWRSAALLGLVLTVIVLIKPPQKTSAIASFVDTIQPSLLKGIPFKGSVTIDARPSTVSGVLEFDGLQKNFKTPFHLANLNVDEEKQGLIQLTTAEGKIISEKFVLGPKNPTWVKTFYFETPKPGQLKVSARPWGQVYVPGVLEGKETPVSSLSLKDGSYVVRVHYPTTNQWVEKTIQIASGSQVICQADFGTSAQMTCRK